VKPINGGFDTLRLRNVGLCSLIEALDTTTPQGRLVFHLFAALAEFERSLIRERTQAGLAAARRAGRTGGRPAKLTPIPSSSDHDINCALYAVDKTYKNIVDSGGATYADSYHNMSRMIYSKNDSDEFGRFIEK